LTTTSETNDQFCNDANIFFVATALPDSKQSTYTHVRHLPDPIRKQLTASTVPQDSFNLLLVYSDQPATHPVRSPHRATPDDMHARPETTSRYTVVLHQRRHISSTFSTTSLSSILLYMLSHSGYPQCIACHAWSSFPPAERTRLLHARSISYSTINKTKQDFSIPPGCGLQGPQHPGGRQEVQQGSLQAE
jgi:hypothetical protein